MAKKKTNTPQYKDGGKMDKRKLPKYTQEVPTANYIPELAPFNTTANFLEAGKPWEGKPMYMNPMMDREQEVVRSADPKRSTASKAGQVARHPLTAASYIVQGQEVPDYLEYANRNKFDNAVDIINPMTYYDAAKRTLTAEHFRDPNKSVGEALGLTALDAAMIYGIGNEFQVGTKYINNPLGTKSVYNTVEANKLKPLMADIKSAGQQGRFNTRPWNDNTPQWKAYDEQLNKVWDKVPRQPIKVPTIKLKDNKVYMVPSENGPALMVDSKGDAIIMDQGVDSRKIVYSPEIKSKIQQQSARLAEDMHYNNTEQDWTQHRLYNPFVNYELQSIESTSKIIPGFNYKNNPTPSYPNKQSEGPEFVTNNESQPQKNVLKKQINTINKKKQSFKEDSTVVENLSPDARIEWYHSHNGEVPVMDSTKTLKRYKDGVKKKLKDGGKVGKRKPIYTSDKSKVQAYQDSVKTSNDLLKMRELWDKSYPQGWVGDYRYRDNPDSLRQIANKLFDDYEAIDPKWREKYSKYVGVSRAKNLESDSDYYAFPADPAGDRTGGIGQTEPVQPYIYQPRIKQKISQIPISQPNQLPTSTGYTPRTIDNPYITESTDWYSPEVQGGQYTPTGFRTIQKMQLPQYKGGGKIDYTTGANNNTMKKKKALLGSNIPNNMRTLDIPPTGVDTQQYAQLYNPPAIPQNVQNQYQQYQETQLMNDPVALNQAKPNKGLSPVSPNVIDHAEPYKEIPKEERRKPNIPISGNFNTANIRAGVFAGINALLPDQVKKDNQNRMQLGYNPNPYGTGSQAIYEYGGHIYPDPDLYKPFPMTPPQYNLAKTFKKHHGFHKAENGDVLGDIRQQYNDQNYTSYDALNHDYSMLDNGVLPIQQDILDLSQGKLGDLGKMLINTPKGISPVDGWRGSKTSAYSYKPLMYEYQKNGKTVDSYNAGTNYEKGIAEDKLRTSKIYGSGDWNANASGMDITGTQHNYNKYYQDVSKQTVSAPKTLPQNYTGSYEGKRYINGVEDVPIGKYGYNMADHGLSVEDNQYKMLSPETLQFTGPKHENGGIQTMYGGNHVEVEGDETGTKDPRTGDFTVFGNMYVPETNIKFKNAGKELGKEEAKISKLQNKSSKLINVKDPSNPYDMLSFNAGQVMQDAVNQKNNKLEAQKLALIDMQTAMLDAAKSSGISPEKIGKELSAKMGISMKKGKKCLDCGGTVESLNNITAHIKAWGGKSVKGFTDDDSEMKTVTSDRRIPMSYVWNPTDNQMYPVPDVSNPTQHEQYIPKKPIGTGTVKDWYTPTERTIPITPVKTFKSKASGKSKSKSVVSSSTLTGDNPIGGAINLDGPQAIGPDPVPFIGPEGKGVKALAEQAVPVSNENVPNSNIQPINKKPYSYADKNRLGISDILPELSLLAQHPSQVNSQYFRPQLFDPYKVSFQDRKNEAQADFNALSRNMVNNPAALASLAAQKYNQENTINAEEFRTNQGIFNDVMNKNYATINEANRFNLQQNDQQMVRQAQAEANTRSQKQQALASISDKFNKRRAENMNIHLLESMSNYRLNPSTGQVEYVGGDHVFTPGNGFNSSVNASQNRKTLHYDAQGNLVGTDVTDYSDSEEQMKLAKAIQAQQATLKKWGGVFSQK